MKTGGDYIGSFSKRIVPKNQWIPQKKQTVESFKLFPRKWPFRRRDVLVLSTHLRGDLVEQSA